MTIAVTEYHPPWPSAWFITGAVLCALGFVAAIWALVLYLAHKEAGRHWCPDPRAHAPGAEQRGPVTRPQGATEHIGFLLCGLAGPVGPGPCGGVPGGRGGMGGSLPVVIAASVGGGTARVGCGGAWSAVGGWLGVAFLVPVYFSRCAGHVAHTGFVVDVRVELST